ncbi:MAG TPA: hypothetical protein DCQ32_00840 [Cyanobacteria bacterium UBA8156]|jgi:hypothetical protein|nr:hypothetical protein [Cyanobacteria bacterium UBA8156]
MNLFSYLKSIARKVGGRDLYPQLSTQVSILTNQVSNLELHLQKLETTLGRIENRQLERILEYGRNLKDWEFRVFSQSGQDGIIQYLIRNIDIPQPIFVEFGVQDYREANTRFLLLNNNWSGLVMDGDAANVAAIQQDPIYWRHDLKANCCFITAENINDLLHDRGFAGEIGLLSIDIDGNDYWVWQAITVIQPAIVICEYNFRFGCDRHVVVPYDTNFVRGEAHFSWVYYGASLPALCELANRKGYGFVGCNSFGNDAFFVRRDLLKPPLVEIAPAAGYVAGKFREMRDEYGEIPGFSFADELKILKDLPVEEISGS